jgi:hypothetical protein
MSAVRRLNGRFGMATPWRRRRMCLLVAGSASPAALREINAAAAFVETAARPRVGARVELHHPEAGGIEGRVRAVADDGLFIAFTCSERSVAFALAAIAADMTRPA